ncbi:MAG: hypothetical protein L6R38_007684 [Xanthoria sp. 2 TBL-2021]|nr:MAG: hypothetical protein L6R38_007684 [Xanthoria sp. 2 TBL-2021]
MAPIGIGIVGLGQRTFKKALDTINESRCWQLVAATDPLESQRVYLITLYPSVRTSAGLQEMLEWNKRDDRDGLRRFEAVYVAVPHHCYADILPHLLSNGIHVLKEKPAGMNPEELLLYQNLTDSNSVVLTTASQRRYGSAMAQMKSCIVHIGPISSIEAKLKLCISNLGEGWRAQSSLAGGGAMADVGWHLLDMIIELANSINECTPTVDYSRLFYVRTSHGHDCEDSADIVLGFHHTTNRMTAHLNISRIGHQPTEEVIITGENGVLVFNGSEIFVHFEPRVGKEHLYYKPSDASDYQTDIAMMFAGFHDHVHSVVSGSSPGSHQGYTAYRSQDMVVTRTLQAVYQHANKQEPRKQPVIQSTSPDMRPLTTEWPIIDNALEKMVSDQLHKDISIYGNGGVFHEFETEFKGYHDAASSYALLHNSGTNALHALYFAAGFMPGDEVIFPVYTFHATCSPAMHFGIKPVFCDATENGTISASVIANAITTKTKAVVVTHMWGTPCDMAAIRSVLMKWPGILLLEDCSHAHGAKHKGQHVGTFGDGAAWSLQGQKIVTGGEGGNTLTKHADIHYRMLVLGHYNKRCKLEIPADHHLCQFALTGVGLKNRAHPLAIAIALNQLRQLPDFHAWKMKFTVQIAHRLITIPFLGLPAWDVESGTEPGWYAFTMRFKAPKAPQGLTREVFVQQLHSKGLIDVDIARSTGLLHREPLFNKAQDLLPHLYSEDYTLQNNDKSFHEAQAFFEEVIKFPVYATANGQAATDRYVQTILEVAANWTTK